MINASDSPHSPSPSHGDQSSEDKDAISAASIVSRGVKKRFKYSCVSSNALSIRSSTAARRHNTHNNAYIYTFVYIQTARRLKLAIDNVRYVYVYFEGNRMREMSSRVVSPS